ncbi:VOC family protein [Thalassobacillus hwangdonensis]|uniref:VOC family protein n=1 Tax=Thalassobacillus hwangdonensis TaxID=546108 RepID=A0ABW3L1X2_9BACI
MNIEAIHHVSLKTNDLDASRRFYTQVLGLKEMERPAFDFSGAWLQVGESQQIHLIEDPHFTFNESREFDTRGNHLALRVDSYQGAVQWLKEHGIEMKAKPESRSGFAQIFCCDPAGHTVELNAPMNEN